MRGIISSIKIKNGQKVVEIVMDRNVSSLLLPKLSERVEVKLFDSQMEGDECLFRCWDDCGYIHPCRHKKAGINKCKERGSSEG